MLVTSNYKYAYSSSNDDVIIKIRIVYYFKPIYAVICVTDNNREEVDVCYANYQSYKKFANSI